MIAPSDKDYIATKLIKQGMRVLAPDFSVLASRIDEIYGIRPINIYYDKIEIGPRVNIIFEYESQALSFREKNGFNYDSTKQEAIANEFRKVVEGYDATKLFVCFSGFNRVARVESNWSIPSDRIEELKTRLVPKNIWKIHRQWGGFCDCILEAVLIFYREQGVYQCEESFSGAYSITLGKFAPVALVLNNFCHSFFYLITKVEWDHVVPALDAQRFCSSKFCPGSALSGAYL